MAQNRTDRTERRSDDAPMPGTPRSVGEWAKATAKSPDDFPEEEARSAEQPTRDQTEQSRPMAQPAHAKRDPAWQRKDHLDPERDSRRPSRSGAAKDAEGQAERGSIDQTITDKGYTDTR